MNYLFIDGSENKTYAQAGSEKGFVHLEFDTRRNLGARLTEISDLILTKASIAKNAIELFAVCVGPGSLTGLRVAGSFLRTSAFLLKRPLIGIDLFTWSAVTLQDAGLNSKVRLLIPTLIDKAFEISVDLTMDLSAFNPAPKLAETRTPAPDIANFGIRWSADKIEKVLPTPEALHKIICKKAEKADNDFAAILKVLPMYVIPSQAERKLEENEC
ncbi:MAG: hypothetical protein Kow0029_15250 [Candidatus Rifleibacteriota bacterium]